MDISQPIPGGVPHQNLCLPPPAPLPQPKQSPMGHVYHQGGIPITEYLRCREKPIARKTHCEKELKKTMVRLAKVVVIDRNFYNFF
jgi:hypothetical protein